MDIQTIKDQVKSILSPTELTYGEIIYHNCDCTILSQSAVSIDFAVNISEENKFTEYSFVIDDGRLIPRAADKPKEWDRYSFACLLQYENELSLLDAKEPTEHKKYSRQGMINRVLEERRQKAAKADYRIQWADNIYGDHILSNENGVKYKIFLRDFENETGYSNSPDSKLNKLGTTKHIMYAFRKLKEDKALYDRLSKTYPFVEIFCDPLNDYKISWYYPHKLPIEAQLSISRYFKKSNFIEDNEIDTFLGFMEETAESEQILIRPEVREKVERRYEQLMLDDLRKTQTCDFSQIKAELFPYQQDGVRFALFRKAAIIADEMGLGKTIQAIATAVLKKDVFGFKKTLVVCPATLKSQWKKEIEKFTDEKALVVAGTPDERFLQYADDSYYFYIVNYETVLRDSQAINKAGIDFLILDEAQKIKNFETKTSGAIRKLQPKHTLVITGTPIENRLIDIYSIVSVLDPHFFGPLWEFSYQHCLFDTERHDKINGYYDLQPLNTRMSDILIRREKRDVIDQLPQVQQIDIPIGMTSLQADYHAEYSAGIAKIISKKFLTPYDLQRLQILLTCMRMVCDSTFLIDNQTYDSPKLDELKYILFEKLDLHNTNRKIIIFSEWVKVHKLIGQMLRENKVGFVELNGKVPVNMRSELIKKFENTPECKVFLSTEAGGAGLNLQMADILFNFELPWNPAKKNQRIGRIDRLGQKSNKLTIYNFITRDSIEQQIAAGLLVKQNLFDGVLDNNNTTNIVDFSNKGRSQFIQQLEKLVMQPSEELDFEDSVQPDEQQECVDTTDISLLEQIEDRHNEGVESADSKSSDHAQVQESVSDDNRSASAPAENKAAELEQVMNNGMQFLAGLFKMSTGKDMGVEHQKIEVDRETGEVVMRFKLPI